MSMAEALTALKMELLQQVVPQLLQQVEDALREGRPVHDVERGLWDLLLQTGRQAVGTFLEAHGSGDLGPTLTLPDGACVRRLDGLHRRRYVSPFGEFTLRRAVYGSREGQAVAFVPLDNRLQLPAGPFSYLLQDWDRHALDGGGRTGDAGPAERLHRGSMADLPSLLARNRNRTPIPPPAPRRRGGILRPGRVADCRLRPMKNGRILRPLSQRNGRFHSLRFDVWPC
jgi:hypothetical protein